MACEVDVMNGSELNEKESVGDNDSDNEILALKQSLKEKLHNDSAISAVNGNGSLYVAAGDCTNSNSVVNNNGTYKNGVEENGLEDEKQPSDTEQETSDSKRQMSTRSKGKFIKGKKETQKGGKSKKHSIKKIDVAIEDESTISEQSWNGTESAAKDTEDESSTIDVEGDIDESASVNDVIISEKDEVKAEVAEVKPDHVKEESSVFSRLRSSMRFSVSPRKQTVASSSSEASSSSSFCSSFESKEPIHYSFRGISGRRPLHRSSFPFDSSEVEPSFSQNLKRKAQSETPGAPQRKYFITSLSERSPGWKFFSSPFNRFWSLSKKPVDVAMSSSTPLRKLHEDVDDVGDSMAVNVGESMDVTLHEDVDLEKEKSEKEKMYSKGGKLVVEDEDSTDQMNWRCNIM